MDSTGSGLDGQKLHRPFGDLAVEKVQKLPVDEGSFGVEQVEFVIEPAPGLHNGRRVGNHADGPLHGGQITARHDGRRLVIDPHLPIKPNE
jgi:hypothetical protein